MNVTTKDVSPEMCGEAGRRPCCSLTWLCCRWSGDLLCQCASAPSLPGLRGGGVRWCGVSFGPGFINTPALGIELLTLWTVAPEHSWLTGYLFPFVSCPIWEALGSHGGSAEGYGGGEQEDEVLSAQ